MRCFKCLPPLQKSRISSSRRPSFQVDAGTRTSPSPVSLSAKGTQTPIFRTEVPDTPEPVELHSKSQAVEETAVNLQEKLLATPSLYDSVLGAEQVEFVDRAMFQALCCICKKAPVPKSDGGKGIKW